MDVKQSTPVVDLLDSLEEDKWRREHPFSEDIQDANKVLLNPYSTEYEKSKAIMFWLQSGTNQPCLFGRIAAGIGRQYLCILTEADLRKSDDHIKEKIQAERKIWKQQAVKPIENFKHGFMILVISNRIALAAPNSRLQALALRIRDLWGPEVLPSEHGNDVTRDHLYLLNPHDKNYYKFVFNLDFFASAADGRWWADHRIPGGLAFTANSLGHWLRAREWYENKKNDQVEWGLKTAMLTIAAAHPTNVGKATWLLDVKDGESLQRTKCPFSNPAALPQEIQNKDWSTYAGYHHTDHSVRKEFFQDQEEPTTKSKPWYMDFSYIYERTRPDFVNFATGQVISQQEVEDEIGSPDTWMIAQAPRRPKTAETMISRPSEAAEEINNYLSKCSRWALDQATLDAWLA